MYSPELSSVLRLPEGRVGADDVYASLVEAIANGRIRAGERLAPEEQLAGYYDVAVMTLRQALAKLREQKYVVTKRGRGGGTRVVEDIATRLESEHEHEAVSVSQLRELSDWRRAVSGEAAFLAALRGTGAEAAKLRQLAAEFRAVIDDAHERRLADARLHLYIAQMSASPRLINAEGEIQERLTRFIKLGSFGGIELTHDDMDHTTIVEAIINGDAEGAREAMLSHVEVTYYWGKMQPSIHGHTPPNAAQLAHPVTVTAEDIARGVREHP